MISRSNRDILQEVEDLRECIEGVHSSLEGYMDRSDSDLLEDAASYLEWGFPFYEGLEQFEKSGMEDLRSEDLEEAKQDYRDVVIRYVSVVEKIEEPEDIESMPGSAREAIPDSLEIDVLLRK